MPEPDLIQQQRAILRAFRVATTERVQTEADAEARRKQELEVAASTFNKARAGRSARRSARRSKGSWKKSGVR